MVNRMGPKEQPSWQHAKLVKVYMKKPLLARIDELAEKTGKNRSEFIQSMLETCVFSDKGYAHYMMLQAKLQMAYWEYEFEKASAKNAIQKENATLEVWQE